MSAIHTGGAVYVNADKSAIVDEASTEAAFLLVGAGGVVPAEYADLYRAHFDSVSAETPKPRDDVDGEKPAAATVEAKPRRNRAANKSD